MAAALVLAAFAAMAQAAPDGDRPKAAAADDALIGTWMGQWQERPDSMMFFVISRRWDGGLRASFGNSVVSGESMDAVTFADGKVKLVAKRALVTYQGTLSADGRSMKGTITFKPKATLRDWALDLTKVDKVPGPKRPQTPHAPYPYDERQVHYRNDAAGITLAGTLTLPRTGGPFPAVLLIPGSGPSDRNEEALFHRPFEVFADYLTRRGIAVLRVDKRGVGESQGDWASAWVMDFAGDALAGVKYLSSVPEIDHRHIGLLGMSEGGMVAPIAATMSPDVSFSISLAGPAMKWFDLIVLQDGAEAVAAGATEEQAATIRAWSTRYYAIARDATDLDQARKELQALKDHRTPAERQAFKLLGDSGTLVIDNVLEENLRNCLKLDPGAYLAKVQCPVLTLFADKDCQVPSGPNLKAAQDAFAASGNKDATAVELHGLNHCFMRCRTGAPSEYAEIEETLSPDVLKLVGDWVETRTKAQK
jgi:hypothetical protein